MGLTELIAKAKKTKQTGLNEIQSAQILREIGLNVVDMELATSEGSALDISERMGFPVVLKAMCSQAVDKVAIHRDGIHTNLRDTQDVQNAYRKITEDVKEANRNLVIDGILVQPMLNSAPEILIRLQRNGPFGAMVSFGLGRVAVDILEDVSYRVVPLTANDASDMIQEVKGRQLLAGYRQWEASDVASVQDILMKLSDLANSTPEIAAIELSPVYAYKDKAIVIDAQITLEN
jgi:acyl-CoA synthetase (NDP forming)